LKNLQQLFSLNKPIVWTMHDMWAFTGGCHYNSDCLRFTDVCNNCPALKFPGNSDFSNKIFKQKLALFNKYKINVVTSSNWLADEVKRSTLLKGQYINVIPTPISIDTFKPLDKIEARKKFKIGLDKFIILFGTMNLNDERKGFTQLQNSLILLYERYPELREKVELLVFGKSENEQMKRIPFKLNNAGKIYSNKNLAQAYNSADVFVAPSLQDNLPNTVMESLACGIPAVVFNIGGMPDIVDHKLNGFLATPYSVEGLTDGIKWFFNELSDGKSFTNYARKKVLDNFTAEKITEQYRVFYKSLLNIKS
jgi:glycosyltransferase involved in cell wall biosynthesis